MRLALLALLAKEPAHGYELKQALEQTFGRAYPAPNIGQIYDGVHVRDQFFMKLALAPLAGAADRMTLINKQRRHCLNLMRGLSSLATTTDKENRIARLLIEGAMLHLQADLDWLERCQEELI